MKKRLAAILVVASACASAASSDNESRAEILAAVARNGYAKLKSSNALLTDSDLSKARQSACQPLAGELVGLVHFQNNMAGIPGLNGAQVIVAEGRCAGEVGWIGVEQLVKAVPPARAQN